MKKNDLSPEEKLTGWESTTWEGARREQLRRWAELPLEQAILAVQEMQELADSLKEN
jgi:hypothetical protein